MSQSSFGLCPRRCPRRCPGRNTVKPFENVVIKHGPNAVLSLGLICSNPSVTNTTAIANVLKVALSFLSENQGLLPTGLRGTKLLNQSFISELDNLGGGIAVAMQQKIGKYELDGAITTFASFLTMVVIYCHENNCLPNLNFLQDCLANVTDRLPNVSVENQVKLEIFGIFRDLLVTAVTSGITNKSFEQGVADGLGMVLASLLGTAPALISTFLSSLAGSVGGPEEIEPVASAGLGGAAVASADTPETDIPEDSGTIQTPPASSTFTGQPRSGGPVVAETPLEAINGQAILSYLIKLEQSKKELLDPQSDCESDPDHPVANERELSYLIKLEQPKKDLLDSKSDYESDLDTPVKDERNEIEDSLLFRLNNIKSYIEENNVSFEDVFKSILINDKIFSSTEENTFNKNCRALAFALSNTYIDFKLTTSNGVPVSTLNTALTQNNLKIIWKPSQQTGVGQ
jgi:hypothetical protein